MSTKLVGQLKDSHLWWGAVDFGLLQCLSADEARTQALREGSVWGESKLGGGLWPGDRQSLSKVSAERGERRENASAGCGGQFAFSLQPHTGDRAL